MAPPVTDRAQVLPELTDSAGRFTDLLRSVRDPSRTAIGEWNTGDVAAHTSHLAELFVDMFRGKPSPVPHHLQMSEHWAKMLAEDSERDAGVLASRIADRARELEELATDQAWETALTWHGGIKIPAYSLPGILINEFELHGLDVAQAERRDWEVSRHKATIAIKSLLPVLDRFVNPDVAESLTANLQVHLRGDGRFYFLLADGSLTVEERPPGKIDCRISADPTAYLLVGYGRENRWGQILRGRIVSSGRKPWLAFRFARLFYSV
ncbi:MAG: SCP2 sterol-binding domain-containing protein [Actinomycetota bacterium]|nr:SCP2 sterol-binding domain-containing protein [Actinomycetota bacterium]